MAIDRIGKGGALPQAPETGARVGTDKTGAAAPFKVERQAPAGAAEGTRAADSATTASPLARLRAGEIDVNGYVDLKVDEATKGLKGLSSSELSEIKSMLREQMSTDPGLMDLARTATGNVPSPPEE